MRSKHVNLLVLALLLPSSLAAQVDIESLRREGTPSGVSGSLGGALSLETGNVDKLEVDLEGRINWVRGSTSTVLLGEGGLGFLGGDRFSSSGLAHLRQTYLSTAPFAPEWYAQINYDRPLLLDFRALAGAGVRASVSGGDWGAVAVGVSLMLEHERLDLPPGAVHDGRTRTLRNSTYLTLRVVGGGSFVASSTAYVQPSLSDGFDDVRVLESLRASASLTDRLALTVTFDLRYDSGPPDGVAALDTDLETGLRFQY